MLPYDRKLKPASRRLRSAMTDAEQRPWHRLRRKQLAGVQCYRQKPLGRYVVDFHLPAARLVVEVDGGQHLTAEGLERDRLRTDWLQRHGLEVLRFDNRQALLETEAVVEAILGEILRRL